MVSWSNIFRELSANKKRISMTIIAIAWGTLSITLMLAIGGGLRTTFGKAVNSGGKDLILIKPGRTSKAFKGQAPGRAIQFTQHDINLFKRAIPSIKDLMAINEFTASLYYKQKSTYAAPYAVPPVFAQLRNIKINPPGRFINTIDMLNYKRVVVLGNKIAKSLFGLHNPLHKTIQLGGKPFKVIGVMQPKIQLSSLTGALDSDQLWIPLTTYQLLANKQVFNQILLLPKASHNLHEVENQIRHVVSNIKDFNPSDKSALLMNDLAKIQKKTNELLLGMQIFLGMIGGITLIVAGIGIANVMFFSVRQSTRDIGVKMALGARVYHILFHYIFEALLVTIIGGLIGIGLTELFIYLFSLIPIHAHFYQSLGKPRPILSAGVLATVVVTLGIVGLFAGLFPAKKAANTNPVEALRNE